MSNSTAKIDRIIEMFKGDVQLLGDTTIRKGYDVISTNSLFLDSALGIGGIPRGRITELWGPESSCKSTLCIHLCANALEKYTELPVAFIDTEHALDLEYAKKLGMDDNRTLISQPETGEQAITIAEKLIRSGNVSLVIIDSVAGLTPQAELEGEVGDSHQALLARLLHKSWRRLKDCVAETNTALVFTNQISTQSMGYVTYKGPGGGNALKFGASIRIALSKSNQDIITVNKIPIGQRIKVRIEKNKIAPPFRECEFYVIFGEGISKLHDILDIALECGYFTTSGTWIKYNDEVIGQGKSQVIDVLKTNDKLRNEITKKVMDYYFDGKNN